MSFKHLPFLVSCLIFAQPLLVNLAFSEKNKGLPLGKGRELVIEVCTPCHSAKLVLQNRMTRENWNETITWMQEKQGLWELTKKERDTILNYLSSVLNINGKDPDPKLEKSTTDAPLKTRIYQNDYKPNPL